MEAARFYAGVAKWNKGPGTVPPCDQQRSAWSLIICYLDFTDLLWPVLHGNRAQRQMQKNWLS